MTGRLLRTEIECEGVNYLPNVTMPEGEDSVGRIRVPMCTNGLLVWPDYRPLDTPVILTPKGWFEMAERAVRMVREANEAWKRIEGRDGYQPLCDGWLLLGDRKCVLPEGHLGDHIWNGTPEAEGRTR